MKIHALDQADAGTRTPDPFITSEVLYQLSYVGAGSDASAGDASCVSRLILRQDNLRRARLPTQLAQRRQQRLAVLLAERRADPADLDQLLERSAGAGAAPPRAPRSRRPYRPACLRRARSATFSAFELPLVHRLDDLFLGCRPDPPEPPSIARGDPPAPSSAGPAARAWPPGGACPGRARPASIARSSSGSGSHTSQQRPSGAPGCASPK